ncbi:hypothetical protein [Effusibacillus dendaii]|uniref:hypothetical protein n=1 Tax=Effusibacillus dendaii TaxID=2743772 RepID=UPI00190A0D66|nr:hypothetical protein [Effusibacillus dendaii]
MDELRIHTGRFLQGLILLGFTVFLMKLFGTGETINSFRPTCRYCWQSLSSFCS